MARPLRIEYEGAFYHITSRGNERKRIFYAKTDYERFKYYLKEAQEKYGYILHCYVLMTNHYHLLMETPKGNMSKVMHYVNGSYTNYINRRRKRSGHLLQGRYKAILIDQDSYLVELSRYIHLNPVRAKMVSKPEKYPHSSYRSYVFKKKEEIVFCDHILGMVSGSKKDGKKRYKSFVDRAIEEDLVNPLKDVYGGMLLGGKQFIRATLSKLKDREMLLEDISNKRELRGRWKTDDVIEAISGYFNVCNDEVLTNDQGYRNILIYLMKKHTEMTNRQIGELIGGVRYATVSKAYQRFCEQLLKDRSLRRTIKEITSRMSHVET